MKFTLSWLKKFLDTERSVEEIAECLTMLGLEVKEIIDRRTELKDFEVAHILATKPHPSADKLKICDVQTSEGILQIVCGASNARENIKVVLAKIGCEIPNGKFKIKESVIRGEKSCGMLCSEAELLVGTNSDGIIELMPDAKIGEPFIQYYGYDDPVFDINVTPNRGDALGVYGIARDLASKGIGTLKELEVPSIAGEFKSILALEIENKEACPLFCFREIRNLQNKTSPDWLKQLLQNIGLKPVSALVDVTNYISYSFGQPMHAYDRSKLSDKLQITLLKEKTKFLALNGKEYDLDEGSLVIQDDRQVLTLAGIIGGDSSKSELETQNVLLEAACFSAKYITKTGRSLQIDTDSRYRFERNIDQAFTLKALNIASKMILSICGGEISDIVYNGDISFVQRFVEFPVDCLAKITGLSLNKTEICNILEKLGFDIVDIGDTLKLTIPSWRYDIAIKEDIVEEIVRIYGYDKLDSIKLPKMQLTRIIPKEQRRISDIKRILATCGYDEVVTNSFMDSNVAKLFAPIFAPIKEELFLLNPISVDNNYMRPNLIANLLKLVQKNLARSIREIALMEIGPIFNSCKSDGELVFASAVRCGQYHVKDCHSEARLVDVFDIKSDLENVLNYTGLSIDKCQFCPTELPYYHPTKSSIIKLGKNAIAYFGQIHPSILKHFDIDCEIFAFEINIANIPFAKAKFAKRDEFIVSDYQPTFRDYSFVVDLEQPVGEMMTYIKNSNKKIIKSVDIFDIYSGDKLPSGKKSMAIKVQFQADDRTLNEADLNLLSQEIVTIVYEKFQGKLRE
ncbi:phenylalanine--tRNA ligase subunit beta [Candidatus Tisiphia endosymbiont of Myopa tessellatipennis]|uniref:phenylalanine--tRNA ligase subunit beta n=1 Tax=Candidatus Tisiphia endosymbiont of Myopa tessellatipennis TaxID=3066257 RepID=UPI00313DA078